MKVRRVLILSLVVLLVASSCSSSKKSVENTADNQKTEATSKAKTDKDKEKERKEKQRAKEKELQDKRKAQLKEQAKLTKEAEQRKRQEDKTKKKTEKEQYEMIKKAEKAKKDRIKEERRKEKEALSQSQKELKKANAQAQEQQEEEIAELPQPDGDTLTIDDILQSAQTPVAENKETKTQREPSTMEQILSMMEKNPRSNSSQEDTLNADGLNADKHEVTSISDKEKKKIIADSEKDEKQGDFLHRTYRKVVPEKVEREVSYPNMYKEKPNSILILYPWNRSKYDNADEMLYVALTKELSLKGYYTASAMVMMDICKKDTMALSSQYTKIEQVKQIGEQYGVDAVMFVTIYRFEKPWWTTNINAVAHYTMISTKTMDTLFSRQADFNYDSQMPSKDNAKDKLITDSQEQRYLGIMEQMQRYVFVDMPVGPRHKKYATDQKKSSNKQEMKYKVKVKPS